MVKALSVGRNIVWNTVGSTIGLAGQWLISVLAVRLAVGFEAAGVYSLAFSIYNIFSPLAIFRTNIYQLSDTEHRFSVGEYVTFRCVACTVSLFLITGYSILTVGTQSLVAIICFSLWKLISLVIDSLHTTNQVNGRMDYVGQSVALQGIMVCILFGLLFGRTGSLELALAAIAACTAAIGLFLDYPRTKRIVDFSFGISGKTLVALGCRCIPLVAGALLGSASISLPRQYLATSMGEAALGAFSSIASPVAIIQSGFTFVYAPLITHYAVAYSTGDANKIKVLLKQTALAFFVVCGSAIVGVAALGEPMLELMYGNAICEYTWLIMPMAVSALLLGLCSFVGDVVVAFGGARAYLCINIVMLMVALVLMPFVQSEFGLNAPTVNSIIVTLSGVALYAAIIVLSRSSHAWT